jgi:cellulose biosynthesis protein BcsQ
MFSSTQKGSGTTTICYLVAHHLASERDDQRILHVDFSADRRRPAMPGTETILTIGQPLAVDLFANIDRTFTRVAIRPGEDHSVAGCSGWVREFLAHARRHCDWIFVDAPSFYAVPETYGVAKACDGVVLVLKSGESRYPALNALVGDLDALGIKTVGTVLNFRQYPIPRWLLKYI